MPTFDDLLNAARRGDLAAIGDALRDIPVDTAGELFYNREISCEVGGTTALLAASATGQLAAVEFLLDRGAPIDQRDGEGETALLTAIEHAKPEVIKFLLERGAAADYNCAGGSAAFLAVRFMDAGLLDYLLTKGAPVTDTLCHATHSPSHVRVLLAHGADPEPAIPRATSNRNVESLALLFERTGRHEFERAALTGDLDAIRAHAPAGNCTAVLLYAAMAGRTEAANLLIDLGANVNGHAKYGSLPLHDAVGGNHLETVRLLLSRGANPNSQAYWMGTPLEAAAAHSTPEMINLLIDRGAQVNHRKGNPLIEAALADRQDIIRALLERGANPNHRSADEDRSALDYAKTLNTTELVDLLRGRHQ